MNSDYLRGATVASRGDVQIVAAGVTFETPYIDTAQLVGPVVFRAEAVANAQLSYTFSIEDATAVGATPAAAGTGNATVTRDDIVGGEATGVPSNGEVAVARNAALSHALAYNGDKRYVRGKLVVANAGGSTQAVAVSLVGLAQPQVTPER